MAGPPREGTPPDASVAQRASDADRERTADRLRRAAGDGRLTVDERAPQVLSLMGGSDIYVPEGLNVEG